MPALNSQQPPGSPVPARSIPPPHHCADPAPETVPAAKQPPLHEPVPRNAPHAPSGAPGTGAAERRREKEQRGQRPKRAHLALPHPGVPLRPLLSQSPPPLSPPRDPPPRRAPTSSCASPPCTFLPALSPVSLPASPAPRSPDSPKPRALPGSPQALPVPGSPLTSRLPPAGKQLTAPCYSPPSLRLSEEAPNRALRLAHMAYAEYRHPNNHRRKSRHSSLP